MRDDRPEDRHAHLTLRAVAAGFLAVPVIALVICESLVRRLVSHRPALVTAGLLVGTMAVSILPTASIDARAPARPEPVADHVFRAIPTPWPDGSPTRPVATVPALPPSAAPESTPSPEAPAVVRFRPRDGWSGVSRHAAVSVRFTRPMDHASTERAFRVVAGDRRVTGKFRWAEGDTVLVLTPSSALPYGARVALSIDVRARGRDGASLKSARSVRFRVQQRPTQTTRSVPAARPTTTPRPTRRASGWRWPLSGVITQRFGESLTKYGYHQGIDIDGSTGDPVRAARRGRVVVAGSYDRCGGIEIHIDHGNGVVSWYRHLSRLDVRRGTVVQAGALIGRVGSTGCSLGSHLHFAIRVGSTFVDPLRYLPRR